MNRLRLLLFLLLALTCALPVAEAAWFRREPPRPGKTTIGKQPVVLPAQLVNNYLLVTVKWDKRGPYNFLIDTGASTCLVSPTLAERYGIEFDRYAGIALAEFQRGIAVLGEVQGGDQRGGVLGQQLASGDQFLGKRHVGGMGGFLAGLTLLILVLLHLGLQPHVFSLQGGNFFGGHGAFLFD